MTEIGKELHFKKLDYPRKTRMLVRFTKSGKRVTEVINTASFEYVVITKYESKYKDVRVRKMEQQFDKNGNQIWI